MFCFQEVTSIIPAVREHFFKWFKFCHCPPPQKKVNLRVADKKKGSSLNGQAIKKGGGGKGPGHLGKTNFFWNIFFQRSKFQRPLCSRGGVKLGLNGPAIKRIFFLFATSLKYLRNVGMQNHLQNYPFSIFFENAMRALQSKHFFYDFRRFKHNLLCITKHLL